MSLDRRAFIERFSALGVVALPHGLIDFLLRRDEPITAEAIRHAEALAGVEYTDEQRERMVEDLNEARKGYAAIRAMELKNEVHPALRFDPFLPPGISPRTGDGAPAFPLPPVQRPSSDEDLAFLGVAGLSHLLRTRQVTSRELTELFLDRLQRYDPVLKAVVTLTAERAREAADRADGEIASGEWRGPLHGIPYGAKDLLAVRGYPTTWGTLPYREQQFDSDAAVIRKLDAAGAVLVAKLTLGELAWGDVWFGGRTNNPWNPAEGSSGSSAGPGAAVSAGLVPFAIGSETLGSIISPSTRNGVTGHRPTFGRVSRAGAMALSWSMDKLGPMTRSAYDCALVFDAIRGADIEDATTHDAPFPFSPNRDLRSLRVGYLKSAFEREYSNRAADEQALDVLRGLGLTLHEASLPSDMPVGAITQMLSIEGAAAFDALVHDGGLDTMARQSKDSWPHVFRVAHLVPAVEYLQAARARTVLMERTHEAIGSFDVVIAPSFGPGVLPITNLTGHPAVSVPNTFHTLENDPTSPHRSPGSLTFLGALDADAEVLMVAHAFQQATDFHLQRPPLG